LRERERKRERGDRERSELRRKKEREGGRENYTTNALHKYLAQKRLPDQ
jgi:hypothetical protein